MLESLCSKYGTFLGEVEGDFFYSFPTIENLLKISEIELKNMGFGYRSKYIVMASKQIKEKGK